IIKVPLTNRDSSKIDINGLLKVKRFYCPVSVFINSDRKGWVPGVFISFKPGFTYSSDDTLDRLNFVKFYSQKDVSSPYQTYFGKDLNCSYIYDKEAKYIKNGNSWYGKNIPSMSFDSTYQYIYHDIFWKCFVRKYSGIPAQDEYGNSMNSVYPNPTNGADMITVPFTLAKANTVAINLVDAQGRVVKDINNAKFNEGTNQVQIGTEGLANGLYFVNMNINGSTLSKSVSVVR
ncbi:MAG: T9SS type A sorting domain-containing protein, partial [Bacteroidetes bacterium]|nr:T9SS type A sorting domain-containing protein [Bacteroidota bacterium]